MVTDRDIIDAIRAVRKELSLLKQAWDDGDMSNAYYYGCGTEGFSSILRDLTRKAMMEGKVHADEGAAAGVDSPQVR